MTIDQASQVAGDYQSSQLDLFLDGMLEPLAATQFAELLEQDDNLKRLHDLQFEIDDSLTRLFQHTDLSLGRVGGAIEEVKLTTGRQTRRFNWDRGKVQKLTMAGSVLLLASAISFQLSGTGSRKVAIGFKKEPLRQVYVQAVDHGFDPYYACLDLDRFSSVMEKRHGIRLTLNEMPSDKKMLGISLLGGISRQTIAILCESRNEPIIVFVDQCDRLKDPSVLLESVPHSMSGHRKLNVFTEEKYGLVFYEVSPLPQPTMIETLQRETP